MAIRELPPAIEAYRRPRTGTVVRLDLARARRFHRRRAAVGAGCLIAALLAVYAWAVVGGHLLAVLAVAVLCLAAAAAMIAAGPGEGHR